MKCPQCESLLRRIRVKIQDADSTVLSYQCNKCGYFDFEGKSINKALEEIRIKEMPLTMKQKIIKLSQGRLGMYFNRDIVRSLKLKAGEDLYVAVPDKKHIVLKI